MRWEVVVKSHKHHAVYNECGVRSVVSGNECERLGVRKE
jgi:hypothetical protein